MLFHVSGVATLGARLLFISSILVAPALAPVQTPPTELSFEVATIKLAQPLNPATIRAGQLPHVGMNVQGTRVDIGFMSLAELIPIAFKVKPFQVAAPDWIKAQRFDILAKMPDGATKEQVPEMLQALLAERFQLKVRREIREDLIYALVVARGGPKLKESPPDSEILPAEPTSGALSDGRQIKIDRGGDGVIVVSPQTGTTKMSMTPDGHMHLEMGKVTMTAFADMLNRFVDRPVLDMTEIKGHYQVGLDLSIDNLANTAKAAGVSIPFPIGRGGPGTVEASDPSGTSIFSSIQQLGLRLEPRKAPIEYVVVDHVEKTPTEN